VTDESEYPTSTPGDEEYPTSTFFDGDAMQAREAGYADGRDLLGEKANLTGADPEMADAYKAGYGQGQASHWDGSGQPDAIGPLSNEEWDRRLEENEERERAEVYNERNEHFKDHNLKDPPHRPVPPRVVR
jgi:hypothetical protein